MALIEGWHAKSMDLLFNQPPNVLPMEFFHWATTNDLALICYLLYLVRELAISSIPSIRIQWTAAIWLNECLIHMHTWLNAFKLIPSSHYKPRIRPIINRVDNYLAIGPSSYCANNYSCFLCLWQFSFLGLWLCVLFSHCFTFVEPQLLS